MANVLLVDDEPLLRSVLCEYLKFAGHTVVECRDGDEALERLRTAGVDAVVSDVLMPGMDGLALCGAMRADLGQGAVEIEFHRDALLGPVT